ncbi:MULTISPECIES: tRNA-queuosine alpha-mannosyltransferase domain-containing protein [Desulfosediminicola]|uniref:tRNA-queuosine alpha-mannosyltransferase domain-containing protein n=1 Tax=Desulfosediminicola TaxID=2886823 RepID=UPI001E5C037A|nr:DUF3524 domain-containing protein [Desulfosediminicola ganghwensis]
MTMQKRVLVIEPYYGGSHQAFLDGLLSSVKCQAVFFTLPARKWKMRMRVSAPWFASQVARLAENLRWFDTVLCSTFVDVAVLRAMLSRLPGWNPQVRFCTYFHENQFAYPSQVKDPSIHQFTSINFNTALVSDRLAFNSHYNLNSFLDSSGKLLKKTSEPSLLDHHQAIAEKSVVLYPGIDFSAIDKVPNSDIPNDNGAAPVIVWNHRWEHDKNPDDFFTALWKIKQRGLKFKLIVLGQSFKSQPECFSWAKDVFANEIIHFGYADSKDRYAELLHQGDIVISTSIHEFFGISVLEAVRAGCRPLLPNRLSYPELFDSSFLYSEGELVDKLEDAITRCGRLGSERGRKNTECYCWSSLREDYTEWLFGR